MADQETRPKRQQYVGNSQKMLSEIRESLKHLKRKPENSQLPQRQAIETRTKGAITENVSTVPTSSAPAQQLSNATRSFPLNNNRRSSVQSYAQQLAEIRSSLEPYATCESGYSSCSECSTPSAETMNRQFHSFLQQLVAIGFDEERAAQALRATSSHSVEAAIDVLRTQTVVETCNPPLPQWKEASVKAAPVLRKKSPPPYNTAVQHHKRTWKGSQDSLNSPKRPASPMAYDGSNPSYVHQPLTRTNSPGGVGSQYSELPNAEWWVANGLVVPQPWQVATAQGGIAQNRTLPPKMEVSSRSNNSGAKMQGGWWQNGAPPTAPRQVIVQQGTSMPVPSEAPPQVMLSQPPPPQFQVTASVINLNSTGRGSGDVGSPVGTGHRVNHSSPNASRVQARPMSFHVHVQTNVDSSSPTIRQSPVVRSSPVTGMSQNNQTWISQNSEQINPSIRNSPVPPPLPRPYYPQVSCPPPVSSPSSVQIPLFVQSYDHKMPPAYVPVPQRPTSNSDMNFAFQQSQLQCPSYSSCCSSQTARTNSRSSSPPQEWRYSSNTETSSNSSISDEMPQSSQYEDSAPPSPSSDCSFGMPDAVATCVMNPTGTVIYRFDSPRPGRRHPKQKPEPERMDVDDDSQSQSSETDSQTSTPMQKAKARVKNCSPQAFKFFMEQHVENVVKSAEQRMQRKHQLEVEMSKVGLSQEAQSEMRRMLTQKESNYMRLRRQRMDISMFDKIKTIGTGAFGEVLLVRKTDTNTLYAMKILRKSEVLRRNQVAHVKAERDILAEADNEWVVKLYYSFQDEENLYFVMDYIPGGDLMNLLCKFGIFQEDLARFYIAELVVAIESVHRMGFVHRDIKPDNVLIDKDGHIKLTDFGLCTGFRWTHDSKYYHGDHERQNSMEPDYEQWERMIEQYDSWQLHVVKSLSDMKPLERRHFKKHMRCQAHSLVGTPNYIAPEVLLRSGGHMELCDWWSVGVILYEMLVGQPPFMAPTPAETQYKVIQWEKTLSIPKQAQLSPEAKDLILRLCTGPEMRLGANGADEIKAHPFFATIDWDRGVRNMPAPYRPQIKYATDTSNFDPVDEDRMRSSDGDEGESSPPTPVETSEVKQKPRHPEHAFFEFTFRRFFDESGNMEYRAVDQGPVFDVNADDDGGKEPVYV